MTKQAFSASETIGLAKRLKMLLKDILADLK